MDGKTSEKLKLYIIQSHADKPLTQVPPASVFDCPIQAGAALTDLRICRRNDLDDCLSPLSERNARYSEASAMYWIGQHIDTPYVGVMHYRRRLQLNDAEYQSLMDRGVDVITTRPTTMALSIEQDYRDTHYAADWDLFMDILKRHDPEDYGFAVDCYCAKEIHPCNINVFRDELYREFCAWAFPILDAFYRNSPEKTDVYQHRDVGFIAERLSHLFVMKMKRAGKRIEEAPLKDLRSEEWDCQLECDYDNPDSILDACNRLYRSRQITKCANVLGEAKRRGKDTVAEIRCLQSIMVAGILERRELSRTLHEYLPEAYRIDIKTLMTIWETTRKTLQVHMTAPSAESAQLLNDCLKLTGFSKIALGEMRKESVP